jgi:hypothetical protein
MEGSCEYVERALADGQQGVALQFEGWAGLITPTVKYCICCEVFTNTPEMDGFSEQIKSRIMRWAGHLARVEEERKEYKVLVERQKERGHSEDQGVN